MTDARPRADTNGKGAAAVMAVGIAALVLGICTMAGDAIPAVAALFNIWKPTGPLSGVTSLTIILWLVAWLFLARKWAGRDVDFKRINWATAVLIVLGLLLTFPPVMDLLQGK